MLTLSGCKFELEICQFPSTARAIHLLNKQIFGTLDLLFSWYYRYTHCSGLRHAFKLLKYNVQQQLQFLGCFDFFDCTLHNMYTVCGKYQPVASKCFCDWSTEFGSLHILFNLANAAVFWLLESDKIFFNQLSYIGYAGLRYFITSHLQESFVSWHHVTYCGMNYGNSRNTV